MICFNAKNSRMFMVLFSLFILFPSMVFAEDKLFERIMDFVYQH